MTFTYDNLDRITYVDMPTGFDDITVTWYTNAVQIILPGIATIEKHWDDLGRDTGYNETGDGTTLYYRKILDAEGRIEKESKGSNSPNDTYDYVLNAAGNPTRITDPRLKVTDIYYIDDQKTVEDAEENQTVFYYDGLPGLHSWLKDPTNKYAYYTYDAIGRLTKVIYNGARTQEYSYNGLDQVEWESHPETGVIDHIYNNENNLWKKTWGGITLEYIYKSDNQIYKIITGDETITYSYDTRARVSGISSTAGWSRDEIDYNTLGSILNERQNIPGLGLKTISYDYDGRNKLTHINYPDGKTAYINNYWEMPEEIKFSNLYLADLATYGHGKQLTYMRIYYNEMFFNASYDNNGALSYTSLRRGPPYYSYRYKANYLYDNVGNITDIYDTVPSLNASFGYDDLYRLTSASYSGGKSYNFTYDEYGNLETAKENGLTVFNQTYLSSNRINSSDFTYDSRGNLETEPGYQYVWNNQNYLTDIKDGAGTTTFSTHLYNERGLRIRSSRLPDPAITVQSPNGAESYYVGTNIDITWSTSGMVGNVKIEYSLNNGSSWTEITASTANDGHYAWTAPGTPSSQCLVRVSEMDGYPSDTSDAVFTIAALPVITVVNPNGGEQLEIETTYWIQWESSVPLTDMKVEYSTNNGSTWTTLVESTYIYSFDWTVPNTPSENCLVRVTDNASGMFDVSDAVFIIEEPAFITITSPNGGEYWETGSIHDITWTTIGPVGNVKILYSLNGGSSWSTIVSSTPNDGSFTWTVPGTTSNNCRVRITDIDNYPITQRWRELGDQFHS
jgi:YD repeat-containing protein